jgi:hypothetical protein
MTLILMFFILFLQFVCVYQSYARREILPPNVQSSATATGGWASNGTMTIKFHFSVKSEGAVAVGCSERLCEKWVMN